MLTIGIPGITLPAWTHTAFLAISGICGIITMVLTGKTPDGKTKTPDQVASQNAPTGTVIKTLALLIGLSLICNFSQAQSPFKGFFTPVKQLELNKNLKSAGDVILTPTNWIFRPAISVNGIALQYVGGNKVFQASGFSIAGFGLSYQKMKVVNEVNYCTLGINILATVNYDIQGVEPTRAGIFASIGVYNNIIQLGIGYNFNEPIPVSNWPYLGVNLQYPF
jgi:hypothetical protein